ncbi:MAG: DUF1080 domain-containing protein [Bacteroidales bacterium]|nr:DUF1080 domain-containing protein [Bacteroidales bacterium]MDT8430609.1 DUF1080 domain-containing protein [Bacteroidales bacterium]
MRPITLFTALILFASCTTKNGGKGEEQWIQLFNGENLDGWDVKIAGYDLNDNFGNTFRVEDGLLKVRYDAYDTFTDQFGHIYYKKKFSHYKLRVEYRFVGEQAPGGAGWAWKNSGVMYHAQSAASVKKDQSFPVSLEGQFLGGDTEGERPTMNLCTPGTHVHMDGQLVTQHCNTSASETIRDDAWVTAEFIVLGDSLIHHLADGDTVLTFTRPVIDGGDVPEGFPLAGGTPLKEGYISLQSESHPIDFRKVEILDLSR